MVPKMVDKPLWEGVWPCLDPWDSVRLRTVSMHWNAPGKYWPHGEFFFFLLKKEPMVHGELIGRKKMKACALIGLHMMAEENAVRLDSDPSLDSGDMWRYGCPKKQCVWRQRMGRKVLLLWSTTSTTSVISLLQSLGRIGQVK